MGGVVGRPGAALRWVRESAILADYHSKSEIIIDYRYGDIEVIVMRTLGCGIMVIDVLFNYLFTLRVPFVITVPLMVAIVPIPVQIAVSLSPSVMISWRILVLLMGPPVVSMPSIPSITISPGVAAECQRESYQCDSDHHNSAYHVGLLSV